MPTGVPRRRGALPHAEGERPLDAGGRKRRHKDDSNSNNDSRQPKSRRQKKNQHESAAPPPPSQKLTPEMKALQDSIVDSYAEKVNALSGQNRAAVYGERKKLYNEAEQLYGGWLTAKRIENRATYLKGRRKSRNPSPTEATSNASQRSTTSLDISDIRSVEAPQPDATACHPTKESHTVDVSPDCSTTASESSSTSTTGFLPSLSLPVTVTAHSCSFNCNRIKLPQECSVRGCKYTVHKMCQHAYLEDRGIDPSNSRPLRCYRHERMLLEKAREKSNDTHPQLKSPPVLQPPVPQPPVLHPPASTDHAGETSTSTRTIGCDWRDVVGGGCCSCCETSTRGRAANHS